MSKVSVIIPVYNTSKYICEAVDSALAQTYKDFEIIVVNDGSTDNTEQVLGKYNHSIKYVYQENKGRSVARNRGIKESSGDFIAFLDADDIWEQDKIFLQMEYLKNNSDITMVFSDALCMCDGAVVIPSMFAERKPCMRDCYLSLLKYNFIPTLTVVLRRDTLFSIGFFDESLEVSEDYDLWLRIAKNYKIGYIDRVLARYRLHGDNVSKNVKKMSNAKLSILKNNIQNSNLNIVTSRKVFSYCFFKIGYNFFSIADFKEARDNFWNSVVFWPIQIKSYKFLLFMALPYKLHNFLLKIKSRVNLKRQKLIDFLKQIAKKILYNERINLAIRSIAKLCLYANFKNIIEDTIPVVGKVSISLPNLKILFLQTEGYDHLTAKLFWGGIKNWEQETVEILFKVLPKVDVFFDVGANIGVYGLIAAIDNPRRKVYAFEPLEKARECIKTNVVVNKVKNLIINDSAVTDYNGEIAFYVPDSKFIPVDSSTMSGFRKDTIAITVPALTLDTFVAINKIPRVDLLKIDTEGAEPSVLEGAKEIIERDRPTILCEVLDNLTGGRIKKVLDNFDYKYFWITTHGLIEEQEIKSDVGNKFYNHLFISKKRLREFNIGLNAK